MFDLRALFSLFLSILKHKDRSYMRQGAGGGGWGGGILFAQMWTGVMGQKD